jgi:hypothetical protein
MIDWNAIATPPRPVPRHMQMRIESVHFCRVRESFEHWVRSVDEMDQNYFGHQPAEPNARGKQFDLFGGAA